VAAGRTLATVDARDLDAAQRQAQAGLDEAKSAIPEAESAIAAAQAQFDLARSTLRRMQDLYEKRSLSAQEFDEFNARVKVQEAAVAMARARRRQIDDKIRQAEQAVQQSQIARGYAEIKAPFAGLVLARRVEPGALSAPGVPLVDVEQTGNYRLEAIVEESRPWGREQGAMISVTVDAIATPLDRSRRRDRSGGRPRFAVVRGADRPAANPALRGGLFGRAQFSTGTRQVLAVPRAAVETQGQLQSVMVEEGGVARARLVSLGAAREETVEVLSGLRAGDGRSAAACWLTVRRWRCVRERHRRTDRRSVYRLQADAAVYRGLAAGRAVLHREPAAGGGAADHRADDRCVCRHARRGRSRGGGAGDAPDGKTPVGSNT
jgi:multidrug efflux pump subunit AcrA (membrane-fusion protein)